MLHMLTRMDEELSLQNRNRYIYVNILNVENVSTQFVFEGTEATTKHGGPGVTLIGT